jgi:YfiH family protein
MNFGLDALAAIFDFAFCIYSMQEAVAETLDGLANPFVLYDVDANARDHGCMLQVNRKDQITFLRSDTLARVAGVVHAFSTRRAERNDFSLGPLTSPNPMIQINRARFVAAIEAPGWPIVKLKQIHSGTVIDVDDTSSTGVAVEGDAAVTSIRGIILAVQTADCVPILIADKEGRLVAAVHAGWRGTAARIAETTVSRVIVKFGAQPANLVAAIGPHIGPCCYEVGEEVAAAFPDAASIERRREWTKPHLNLSEANRRQLLSQGIPEANIDITSLCTKCRDDLFHSYRRDGTRMGHLLSVIGLAP